jgi:hypothetical protein
MPLNSIQMSVTTIMRSFHTYIRQLHHRCKAAAQFQVKSGVCWIIAPRSLKTIQSSARGSFIAHSSPRQPAPQRHKPHPLPLPLLLPKIIIHDIVLINSNHSQYITKNKKACCPSQLFNYEKPLLLPPTSPFVQFSPSEDALSHIRT